MYALRSCITTSLFTLLLLGLLTSCRHPNKSSDIQAHETLVHVQALLQSDSFPENDSLLTPSIRFFTQHGPDSLLAQAYYLQGEILRHHHFMLRASDAYIKALELCPDSSQLRFRIHLAQAKTCRIEKIASEAAHHLNLAGRLLPALRHQGCRTDFLHEKAMLCLLRQDTNAATRYFKAVTDASAPHSAVSRQTADCLLHLADIHLQQNHPDSALRFAQEARQRSSDKTIRRQAAVAMGMAYARANRPDSAFACINPHLYAVNMDLRADAYRALYTMFLRLRHLAPAQTYLLRYIAVRDSLRDDITELVAERLHALHEYKLQRERTITAKRNEARNKLQFYRLLACTIGLLALLLMLLYRSRLKKLRLAQQLRNQQFQTMEESLRRKEAEIYLAQQEEELQRQQIRQIQQNLDYYKQLNRITLPVLMRRQNSQGALHLTDDDWDIIIQNADACFNHFSRRLRHHCPQLTDDDVRFCCLVKMNLPLAQLAEIYHIAKGSISRRKMRLKEKMNIAGRSFDEFLADF